MKIFKDQTVFDAALERINYIYDEFDDVMLSSSGGKDSTVILELTLMVARQRNRLPLKVIWLDQEAELKATVEYMTDVFTRTEVEPYWLQVPFQLFNSSSWSDDWLYCWDKKDQDKWVHPQHPLSIKENVFGTVRFKEMLIKATTYFFKDNPKPCGVIYGLKANESMVRKMTLTLQAGYKNITWSSKQGPKDFKFAPLYDWSDDDIWIAIEKNGWKYNRHYDEMYRHGIPVRKMRVSSLIHETSAEHALKILQEIEPDTYDKLTRRIGGVSTYSKLMDDIRVYELPVAFASWAEYKNYLIDNVVDPSKREIFDRICHNEIYLQYPDKDKIDKSLVQVILANDYEGTKIHNLMSSLRIEKKKSEGYYDRKYRQG